MFLYYRTVIVHIDYKYRTLNTVMYHTFTVLSKRYCTKRVLYQVRIWVVSHWLQVLCLVYSTVPYKYCTWYTVLCHTSIWQGTDLSCIVVPIQVGLQILTVSFKRLNWSLGTKHMSITLVDMVYLFKFAGRPQSLIALWTQI